MASGAGALLLQHETPRIIDRVNTFYGYGAIVSLKVVQGHIERDGQEPSQMRQTLPESIENELRENLKAIEDEKLRN